MNISSMFFFQSKMYRELLKLTIFVSVYGQLLKFVSGSGILYPRESESREVKSLDGIWSFRLDGVGIKREILGFDQKWFLSPLENTGDIELMPVPSSYNDITQRKEVRDHIGWVWYSTSFFVPSRWMLEGQRVFIRFGSANYYTVVWLNGEHLMNHTTGGHLPFQAEITNQLKYGQSNLLVVSLNNTLGGNTVPQGTLHMPIDQTRYPEGFVFQTYNFDYFHFAGIHRPVYIYTTPKAHIDDITVTTTYSNYSGTLIGKVNYEIEFHSLTGIGNNIDDGVEDSNSVHSSAIHCNVAIRDKQRHKVGTRLGCSGTIDITDVKLWWPYLSGPPNEDPGYLYELEVHLTTDFFPDEKDIYRLPFGVRTVEVTNTSFLVNGQPFYFRGFGRHEDYSIRGRGVDFVSIVKDHNLIKWSGANSYRTSHYPYAEEILQLTDRLGIVVISESPAIGLSGYGPNLLRNHLAVMQELVQRDKNSASVLVWSIGNEPQSMQANSRTYFETVIKATREEDPQKRPITIVLSQGFPNDTGPAGLDIISINRYFAWYGDTGRTQVIQLQIPTEVRSWHEKYNKPVLITEYGAGTVAGMHMNPSFTWTEDFQVDYHIEHFKAFDHLRANTPYFIGEMIWNFADFATPEETFRPWGCMKGIFTRERQPKQIAHIVRWRYWKLANETNGFSIPNDLKQVAIF